MFNWVLYLPVCSQHVNDHFHQIYVSGKPDTENESDYSYRINTAQKMKFSIKDFFSKCDQIRSFLQIWSHSLKKSLMENFILCAV